jgi:methanogenic corrinoid protein MtbC1
VNSTPDQKRHPIRIAARRAGLTPELLRAWELRYEAIDPGRTEGGQRRYSDADIERLRLLRLTTEAGRRIGDVAGLEDGALHRMVAEDRRADATPPRGSARVLGILDECLAAAREFDQPRLAAALSRSAVILTPTELVQDLVSPLMRRIGQLWLEGEIDPANEHMTTSLVREVLTQVIVALPPDESRRRLVVATPAGERHEIGALLAATMAAAAGWAVTYLGPDLPAASIVRAALAVDAQAVAISVVHPPDADIAITEIVDLRRRLDGIIEVFAGGAAALAFRGVLEEAGVRVLEDVEPLPAALEDVAA